VHVGVGPSGIAAADLNRDGHADLVVSNSGIVSGNRGANGNTIAVLLGKGDGTFADPTFIPMPHTPEGIAVADFNHDGNGDVVVVLNATDQMAELLGNGDGTFQPARLFAIFPQSTPEPGTSFGPVDVALADFDGDGNTDVAIANALTSTIGVLSSDGAGGFRTPHNLEVGRTPIAVLTGDYNRDGKPDFLSANSDGNSISVVLGTGSGFLQAPAFLAGPQPISMVTADFNHDGNPDVAVAGGFGNNPKNLISVLLGKAGGLGSPAIITTSANIANMVVADVNHDGNLDLIATNFGTPGSDVGGLTELLGRGDGTFQPPVNIPAGGNPIVLAVADFNGDGKLDVVVSNRVFSTSVDSLNFLPGDGRGGFGALSSIISFPAFSGVSFLTSGDFNGDGKADIAYVLRGFRSSLVVQFGNGNGTFQSPKVLTTVPIGSDIFTVSTGDLNNDGHLDFAVEETGVIEVLLADGTGSFVSTGLFSENEFASFSFVPSLLLADFNGDGMVDIAATDGFDDNVAWLPGHGDGTFGFATLFGGGHTAAAVTADFNGDGRPDIALTAVVPTASPNSPGEVIVLLNTTPR
jgi:hypothetical protein